MPLWSVEDLKTLLRNMGHTIVNDMVDGKDYTVYDVNFLAQRERIIHKSLGLEPKKFVTLAIESLDVDSEYAYETYQRLVENYDIK